MRLFMLVSIVAVLHLSVVNSQLGDSIDSNAPADSAFDTDNNDGVDDSKLVASDSQGAPNPALVDNADASDTDENNAITAAKPDDAVALCGADNSQVDGKLDARDEGFCSANPRLPTKASPPNAQSNDLKIGIEKLQEWLKGNGWRTRNSDSDPKNSPFIKNGSQRKKCKPPYDFDVCCDGPLGDWISIYGQRVLETIERCTISTSWKKKLLSLFSTD